MKYLIAVFIMLDSSLFASGGEGYDIVPRTINFLIFVWIMYYLVGDKVKDFFVQRTQGVQRRLDEVQERLKHSRKEREGAEKALEDAKKMALDIVETAKKDARIISENINNHIESEINNIEKQFEEKMAVEKRKAVKIVVDSAMKEILDDDTLKLGEDEISEKLIKKVA